MSPSQGKVTKLSSFKQFGKKALCHAFFFPQQGEVHSLADLMALNFGGQKLTRILKENTQKMKKIKIKE